MHLHMKVDTAEETKSRSGLRNFLGTVRLSEEFVASLGQGQGTQSLDSAVLLLLQLVKSNRPRELQLCLLSDGEVDGSVRDRHDEL